MNARFELKGYGRIGLGTQLKETNTNRDNYFQHLVIPRIDTMGPFPLAWETWDRINSFSLTFVLEYTDKISCLYSGCIIFITL